MTLQVELRRHLTTAPIFIPLITDRRWEFYEKWISDSASALWMAYYDGATVAFIGLQPSAQHDTVMPVSAENTVAISWAFTEERVRRGGVGTALLNHSLTWAQSLGYENCSVDFESANILASRFWLGRGFQPVCYSMIRHVDERIAKAGQCRTSETDRRKEARQ